MLIYNQLITLKCNYETRYLHPSMHTHRYIVVAMPIGKHITTMINSNAISIIAYHPGHVMESNSRYHVKLEHQSQDLKETSF